MEQSLRTLAVGGSVLALRAQIARGKWVGRVATHGDNAAVIDIDL